MRAHIKKMFTFGNRMFFLMMDGPKFRLWEIMASDKKMSAQMVEVRSPEREHLLNRIQTTV